MNPGKHTWQVLFDEHDKQPVTEQFTQAVLFELNVSPSLHDTQVVLVSQIAHPEMTQERQVPTELICSLLKQVLQKLGV